MNIGMQNWIVRIHLSSTNESTWTSSTGRTSRSRSGRAIERVPRGCSTIGVQKGVVSIRTRSRDKEPTTGSTGGNTRSRRGSTSARVGSGGVKKTPSIWKLSQTRLFWQSVQCRKTCELKFQITQFLGYPLWPCDRSYA